MAPGAKLVFQEIGDGFEYLNDRGGTLWNLADVAFQNGARIHSNSWGGACYDQLGTCVPGCTMPYDSFARDADLGDVVPSRPLVVTAAGNGGAFCPPPISVGTPSNAKNVLTVGIGRARAGGGDAFVVYRARARCTTGGSTPTVAAQGESTVSAASDANLVDQQLRLLLPRRDLDVRADGGGAGRAGAGVLRRRLPRGGRAQSRRRASLPPARW